MLPPRDRFWIVVIAFAAMLWLGPIGFRRLFPFDMRGGPAVLVFGPIYLCIVWAVFTVVLAIWVIDRSKLLVRVGVSLGYGFLLTFAWLAVLAIHGAVNQSPSNYGPGP